MAIIYAHVCVPESFYSEGLFSPRFITSLHRKINSPIVEFVLPETIKKQHLKLSGAPELTGKYHSQEKLCFRHTKPLDIIDTQDKLGQCKVTSQSVDHDLQNDWEIAPHRAVTAARPNARDYNTTTVSWHIGIFLARFLIILLDGIFPFAHRLPL